MADVNADGRPDVVTSNYYSADVSVLLGNGDGTFASPLSLGVGLGPADLVVDDFNNDGRPDVAAADQGPDSASVLLHE